MTKTTYTNHTGDTISLDDARKERRYIILTVKSGNKGTSIMVPVSDIPELAEHISAAANAVLLPRGTFHRED